jgi:hypothetical protein
MKKGKVAGERKIVEGRVVIRRRKSERRTAASETDPTPKKAVKPLEYETGVKRHIDGFLRGE